MTHKKSYHHFYDSRVFWFANLWYNTSWLTKNLIIISTLVRIWGGYWADDQNHVDQEVGNGQESGIVRNRGAPLGVSLTTDYVKSRNLKKKLWLYLHIWHVCHIIYLQNREKLFLKKTFFFIFFRPIEKKYLEIWSSSLVNP